MVDLARRVALGLRADEPLLAHQAAEPLGGGLGARSRSRAASRKTIAASTSYGCVFSIASTAVQQNASASSTQACVTPCLDSGAKSSAVASSVPSVPIAHHGACGVRLERRQRDRDAAVGRGDRRRGGRRRAASRGARVVERLERGPDVRRLARRPAAVGLERVPVAAVSASCTAPARRRWRPGPRSRRTGARSGAARAPATVDQTWFWARWIVSFITPDGTPPRAGRLERNGHATRERRVSRAEPAKLDARRTRHGAPGSTAALTSGSNRRSSSPPEGARRPPERPTRRARDGVRPANRRHSRVRCA